MTRHINQIKLNFNISGMISRIQHSFLLLIFCVSSILAKATTDPPIVTKLEGKNANNVNEIVPGAWRETVDVIYYDPVNINYIENPVNDVYLNTIALLVNEDDRQFITADFRVTILLRITWTDKNGTQQGPIDKSLEVDYKIAEGTKYDARNYFYFDNARKVKIEILSIDPHGTTSWNPTEVLVLENRMEVKRDYIFNVTGTVSGLQAVPGDMTAPPDNKFDELVVSWNDQPFQGVTHYDIEWAWVTADAQDRYKTNGQFDASLIFRNNSTRITIPGAHTYKVPLIYDGTGYLFYRIRPLQYRENGDIKEGEWSAIGTGGITYYSFAEGHQSNLNWQVSTTYAEDGKRKTVISYFDGTLRSRQTVTKDNVNNNTVVAETLYDYQGRPAINILPAPTLDKVIHYAENFNRFASTGNPKDIYDLVPVGQTICTVNTPVLDNNNGAAQYYSPNNPKVNDGFNKYIPDAEGYPYTETRYTPDATGRIASQGGVGAVYQLGAGKHASNYYYGQADQHELNALFGTEVGEQSHYFKNMVRDANGQYSVSYVDMHGRTIATALAGEPPTNMQTMESYQQQTLTRSLLGKENNIVKDRSIESSTTLLVPLAGLHTFHYELNPQDLMITACNPPGQPVCYDCYYDLEIRVTGTCGQGTVIITRRNFTFGNYDSVCNNTVPSLVVDTSWIMEEGEYNITKKLTLSSDAQQWYRDNLFTRRNICKTLQEFYNEIYQVMQANSNCNMTCESCNTALGSYQDYRTRFLQSQGVNPAIPASELPYENEILASFNEAKAACDALCIDPENKISSIRDQMLEDMTPHQGQYAKTDVDLDDNGIVGESGVVQYDPSDTQHEFPEWELNTTRPYNIFRNSPPFDNYRPLYAVTPNCPAYYPFYLHPKEESNNSTFLFYKDENGSRDNSINPASNNTCNPVSPLLPDNFTNQFKESWGEALLYYHPEYCKLKTIENNTALKNSYAWDSKLENVDSWQAALTAETSGYILGNTATVSAIINKDPFFTMAGNSNYKNIMLGFVNNNFRAGKSMWQYAMMSMKCGSTSDPNCYAAIPSFPVNSDYYTPILPELPLCSSDKNNVWRIFRSIYLTIKDSMLNDYLEAQCGRDYFATVYNDMATLKYKRRFGNYDGMYFSGVNNAIQTILSTNDPENEPQINSQLNELYNSTCEGYIQVWKNKLLECDVIANHAQKEQILSDITSGMKKVCVWGSDPDHPYGSSTLKPGDPRTPQSFEQVITDVFAQYYINPSALCNKYMIDYPQPYDAQLPTSNEPAANPKDSCMCARLAQLQAERLSDGYTGTLSQFIQYKHGVYIRQTLLMDTLIPACNGGTSCNSYDPPIDIPGILNCNSIYKTCISCSEYTALKQQFMQEFPSFTVIYQNPATDEELNRNIAFERFMNRHTSFRKSWLDYLQFEQACASYNQSWSCTTLDSIVNAFQQANATASWGNSCEQQFTLFFNQAFATFYTFPDIQALFMQYCGHLPDVCRPVIDCNAFRQRITDFYTQFGNSIAGSSTCQQQFTNFFNNYYSSNYIWTELQQMHLQLCGYQLDVCTPLNCNFLQQVLNSWRTTHPLAWMMQGDSCNVQWVAYFNSQAYTNLQGWQIAELYSNCSITLEPCSPPLQCETLRQYLVNYMNLGNAACDSSGLNPESPSFCQDCITWYMNQKLNSSYTYAQLNSLYLQVCGEELQVCENYYSCRSLTDIAANFIAQQYSILPQDCQEAFRVFFNQAMSSDFTYQQIMNIYMSYCGQQPAVCGSHDIITCESIQNVYNNFRTLYPDPSGYFGPLCQQAFADYFNQAFGDTLTYQQINNYFINLCGTPLDICISHCVQLQTVLNNYNLQYNSYLMPQQMCHDLFTKFVNNELQPQQPLTWQDVQNLYANCDISLNICPPDGTQILACGKLEGARKAFYGFYSDALPQNCDQVFTEFFNLYFRTAFINITELQNWVSFNCNASYNVCSGNTDTLQITLRSDAAPPPPVAMPPMLCDAGPLFPTLIDTTSNCEDIKLLSFNAATEQYNIYIRNKKDDFDKKYKEKCISAGLGEVFTVLSNVAEYHYTLYYYDQAGSLVKTVPPTGVHADFSTNFYNAVEAARQNVLNGQPLASNIVGPPHTLTTEYRYNTLGQVVQQKSPDGGLSKFWYDELGRLVISQNAKQATTNKYSYTKYDALGRITEVGQTTSNDAMTQATSQNNGLLATWMNNAAADREQMTITVYDVPQENPDLCVPPGILCQKNLRNRVSYTYVKSAANFINNNLPYNTATYYTYDIHGNVDILLQHYNDGIMQTLAGNAFKKITYKYDLISGKVNEVAYQAGYKDQFYHHYFYDAENKLTKVKTSADNVYWPKDAEADAAYSYYLHGPLARTEIGQLKVQGVDYVYTLQGWLKGVNATSTGSGFDVGADYATGIRPARDAYGFSLNYNTTDYKPINNTVTPFVAGTFNLVNTDAATVAKPLYNGNISAMMVNIPKLGDAHLYGYKYDQLNRIVSMDAFGGFNNTNNIWTNGLPAASSNYKERVSYDANGNILTYLRNGTTVNSNPLAMDNLTYNYIANSNKLSSVNDAVAAGNYTTDIDNQAANNYDYDEIGNMIKDNQEGITNIEWTVYGKIKTITKTGGPTVSYTYDASGNRISKQVGTKTTFYVRDASGNVMAIYENGNNEINSGKLSQIEVDLYGSSRLGIWKRNLDVESTNWWLFETTAMPGTNGGRTAVLTRGTTTYELSNHLGNVLVTVSDRKIQVQDPNNTTQTLYYTADVITATDYYPFGMMMPSRSYYGAGNQYRYGYNGKELDKDISNDAYDYGMRISDQRLGRFLSVDPISDKYPELTPYQYASNRPIDGIDEDGLEVCLAYAAKFLSNQKVAQEQAHYEEVMKWLSPHIKSGSVTPRDEGFIKPYEPPKSTWKSRWKNSNNFFAKLSYGIVNGFYTTGQQLAHSVTGQENIQNIGGGTYSATDPKDEDKRVGNFVNAASTLIPAAPVAKLETTVLTKLETSAVVTTEKVLPKVEAEVIEQSATIGQKLLPASTTIERTVSHHIFNAFRGPAATGYRNFFKNLGINVDEYTVKIPESLHKYLHREGSNWTTAWKKWIDANPSATAKDVYQQAGKMMDEAGINNLKILQHR